MLRLEGHWWHALHWVRRATPTRRSSVEALHLTSYFFLSSVLLVHEYIVTIDQEVEVIWSRKWTGPTMLFLLNRYPALANVNWGSLHAHTFNSADLPEPNVCGLLRSIWPLTWKLTRISFMQKYIVQYSPWSLLQADRIFQLSHCHWIPCASVINHSIHCVCQ